MLLIVSSAVLANQKPQKSDSDSDSHSNSDKKGNGKQIAEWEKQIKILIKERQECIDTKQKKIDELKKKIEEAQKKCANQKKNKIHVGNPRLLNNDKKNEHHNEENSDEDSDENSASEHQNNKKKAHHNNSEESSESEEKENNHQGKNNKNHNGSAWGKNEHKTAKINAASKGQSFGKGGSTAMAGPQGAQSQAKGSKGTKTGSSFNSDETNAFDNWGVTNKNGKADAWGTKGKASQKVSSNVKADTFGKGESGTMTGRNGAQAFGNGEHGSKTGADWKGDVDSKEESFGVKKFK